MWGKVRGISKNECEALIRAYLDGKDHVCMNRQSRDKYHMSGTMESGRALKLNVLIDEDDKTITVLAAQEI